MRKILKVLPPARAIKRGRLSFGCGWILHGALIANLFYGLLSVRPAFAAEPGWSISQITSAQGKQQVLFTAHAVAIKFPKQKYRIYSFAPQWNIIYINDQIGTYIDYSHDRFFGSIIGRLGSQLGTDIQVLSLPEPRIIKEKGHEFSLYDQKFKLTGEERARMHQVGNSTVLYGMRSLKCKYLRLSDMPKQIKELVCKLSGVPMSIDFPLECSCTDGFKQQTDILVTAQMSEEKAVNIVPPDLKSLKQVHSEAELLSHSSVNDVFELFGDAPVEKPGKAKK